MSHYDYGFRIYNPAIGKFLSVDPLTSSYPELTPYQFAHNRPIEFIDIDGLEGISINDKEGNQRENTSYGNTSDKLLKGSIDKISQNDGVTICDIKLTDVGPQEFLDKSSPITGGVSKSVYHEYSYIYQGVDVDGNSVNGSGSFLQPVGKYKVGSSLIDAAVGGFLSWGFAKVGNIKLSNTSKVVNVVDDAAFNFTDDIALGLRQDLDKFSKEIGAKNYRQFTSGGIQIKEIQSVIENSSNKLHFNLTNFLKYKYMQYAQIPTKPTLGNITNWELHTIYNTPGALQRTTFYNFIDGQYKVVPKPF